MRAFESDPKNATLALGIAHAEHVRGHLDEARSGRSARSRSIRRPLRDTS